MATTTHVLKVVSWNVNRRPTAWKLLGDLDADVALLQEANRSGMPESQIVVAAPPTLDWKMLNGSGAYGTAILLMNPNLCPGTVPEVLASHPGQFGVIHLPVGDHGLYIISVYAFFRDKYADTSMHRAISDLTPLLESKAAVLMAGDINTFRDYTLGGTKAELRRYQLVFERLSALGMECLGPFSDSGPLAGCPCRDELNCRHVKTYRHYNRTDGKPLQLDFAFGNKALRKRFVSCKAVDDEKYWAVSDHAPVEVLLSV